MHGQQQGHQAEQSVFPRNFPGWLAALAAGVGYHGDLLLRDNIGERRVRDMGGPLLLALLALAVCSVFGGIANLPPVPAGGPPPGHWLVGFLAASVAMHVRQRIKVARRRRKGGPLVHSHYTGRPELLRTLGRLFPALTEAACKRWLDPLFALGLGAAALPFCAPVGLYLVLVAAAVGLNFARGEFQEREMALDAADGMLDMLTLQANVDAECRPAVRPQVAARVVTAAPLPQEAPRPARAASRPAPPPVAPLPPPPEEDATPALPAAPPDLCAGLSDGLLDLLRRQRRQE